MQTSPLQPVPIDRLTSGQTDCAFVAFASPERRSLGITTRLGSYSPKVVCLLCIEDELNDDRTRNIKEFERSFSGIAPVHKIAMRHADLVYGIGTLVSIVQDACDSSGVVTIDISTFPKSALLLILRAIDRIQRVKRLRVLYTEPAAYAKWLQDPISYGVRRVAVVPTFAAPYRANQDLVFIAFLGYERDRALGMWQSIEPNRTIAVIGKPAYHQEWEGMVEVLNAALLAGLDQSCVHYINPRDPIATYELLKTIIEPWQVGTSNYYIAPLGTKPQTVGIHYFCSEFPEAATIAYASPLSHNLEYISHGIGPSWELPHPGDHK